jgi:hypothetical protein
MHLHSCPGQQRRRSEFRPGPPGVRRLRVRLGGVVSRWPHCGVVKGSEPLPSQDYHVQRTAHSSRPFEEPVPPGEPSGDPGPTRGVVLRPRYPSPLHRGQHRANPDRGLRYCRGRGEPCRSTLPCRDQPRPRHGRSHLLRGRRGSPGQKSLQHGDRRPRQFCGSRQLRSAALVGRA